MKKFIYITLPLCVIIACGGNGKLSESDKIEIQNEKESIELNWNGILQKYYEMNDDDLKNTEEYYFIEEKTNSNFDEVSKMAKSYLDSVDNLKYKSHLNFCLQHFDERKKIYEQNKFYVKYFDIPLKSS